MFFYFSIIFFVLATQLTKKSIFQNKLVLNFILLSMFLTVSSVILLNPFTSDMVRYLGFFQEINTYNWLKAVSIARWEIGFVSYQWLISRVTTSDTSFILISIASMWVLVVIAIKKVVNHKDLPLIMVGYLSFFYFYNFLRNVLRQGFAVPLIVIMLLYLGKGNYKKAFFLLSLAISFHLSAIIGIILFVIKTFKLTTRALLLAYIMSSFLMITGINQWVMIRLISFFGGNYGDAITGYTSDSVIAGYGSTNRIDFLIFTTFWLILGIWFKIKYLKNDSVYDWLLKSYIGLSIIYILLGFIGYSDRLASYAWFMIPILVFYPVINMKSRYRIIWMILCITINISMFFFFDVDILYRFLQKF